MMDEQRELDIRQYRESAAAWGERAARALVEGDEGAARTARDMPLRLKAVEMSVAKIGNSIKRTENSNLQGYF